MMAPKYEKAAAMLEPSARFAKVNTEEAQGLAQRFNIRSIPTMALFRGGREIARQSGAMGAAAIANWCEPTPDEVRNYGLGAVTVIDSTRSLAQSFERLVFGLPGATECVQSHP
jgi:thioredoxin-like negative regulator of GroEL